MSIWGLLDSATDKLKQNAPDLTQVTNACQNSFHASATAASNVYKAITVDGAVKVKEYLPDPQTQEKMLRIGKDVVFPELLGRTGMPVLAQCYRIWQEDHPSSSVHDGEKFEHQRKEFKKLQMKNEELREAVKKMEFHNKILREQIVREPAKKFGPHNDLFHLKLKEKQKPRRL